MTERRIFRNEIPYLLGEELDPGDEIFDADGNKVSVIGTEDNGWIVIVKDIELDGR